MNNLISEAAMMNSRCCSLSCGEVRLDSASTDRRGLLAQPILTRGAAPARFPCLLPTRLGMPVHRAYQPHNVVFRFGEVLESWDRSLAARADSATKRTEMMPRAGWLEGGLANLAGLGSAWKRRPQKKACSFPFLASCSFPILQRKLRFVSCSFPVSFPARFPFPRYRGKLGNEGLKPAHIPCRFS